MNKQTKQKQNQTYKLRELIVAREGNSGMGRMGEGQWETQASS